MNRTLQNSLATAAALVIVAAMWAPVIVVPVDPAYAAAPLLA